MKRLTPWKQDNVFITTTHMMAYIAFKPSSLGSPKKQTIGYNTRAQSKILAVLAYNPHSDCSELNDFMCNMQVQLNRTGTLCGKCQDGYYPLAYSYDMMCVQCPNEKSNWWKFVLAAFLPLTIFCIIILFFKINVVSSRFQGFLFYSQVISMPATVRVFLFLGNYHTTQAIHTQAAIRSFAAFYGFWNLDFFCSIKFGICLGTDALQTLALDFVIGIYPLLLMVASYVLIELCLL